MKIKICGITSKEDAENAVSLGVHALGFIFYSKSERAVTPEKVQEIRYFLPPFISTVGVFVNESVETINEIAETCKLDTIQLHGDESAEDCLKINRPVIKAIRVSDISDIEQVPIYQGTVSGILLDTKSETAYGGTGHVFDWGLALSAKDYDIPIILSGGINAENVERAVQLVNPYGIDINSGVESAPGKKDYEKMKELINSISSFI